ncbi:MAG: hypothetical protein BHW12_02825 [Coprobacillus sp. 28_7]|nr:MAG: hypothetical protein BHW12_02825 [Coprobacillus sp. 28_7]
MLKIWGNNYYKNLQNMCTNIDINSLNKDEIKKTLTDLFEKTESAKILCAENEGSTGVKYINNLIKKLTIDDSQTTSVEGYFTGELMMINKNNMVEQATPQQKKVPIQFYLTEDMKKRLKMYCVANDTNMKDVLVDILDKFLKSEGF